jgi:hypothetical protein
MDRHSLYKIAHSGGQRTDIPTDIPRQKKNEPLHASQDRLVPRRPLPQNGRGWRVKYGGVFI